MHKITDHAQRSFIAWHQREAFFGLDWHYHAELELHHVIQGKGIRFIGDNVSQFKEGDLILLGQNLPHFWKSSDEYLAGKNLVSEAIVIQFLPETFGRDFLSLSESFLLPELFDRAKAGLVIAGHTKQKVVALMQKALHSQSLDSLVVLLEMINTIAKSEDVKKIASFNAFSQTYESDTLRLNEIYRYTLNQYNRDLSLEEIAAIANLSVTSFCRYFKAMTKKTFNDFLTEIRISHACRMLIEDKLKVDQICFACGFNNVSNFYRHFKRVQGLTPLQYKRKFVYPHQQR